MCLWAYTAYLTEPILRQIWESSEQQYEIRILSYLISLSDKINRLGEMSKSSLVIVVFSNSKAKVSELLENI